MASSSVLSCLSSPLALRSETLNRTLTLGAQETNLHAGNISFRSGNSGIRSRTSPGTALVVCRSHQSEPSAASPSRVTRRQAALTAASVLLLTAAGRTDSASAGILSGSTGLEAIPSPSFTFPGTDTLKQMTEEQKRKYEELDEKFKASPLLKDLLKKSAENKEKNQAIIQNKYCERGAEWGVGDCSLVGLPKEDREAFRDALKAAKSKERE